MRCHLGSQTKKLVIS